MNATQPLRDVAGLASDAIARAVDLVQIEIRLARAEISEKLAQWKVGAGLVLAAAVFGSAALLLILQALVVGLVEAGLSASLATLLVAGLSLAIAAICFTTGRKKLDVENVTPERTIHQVSRDTSMVKEKFT